ncbi:hypothetical protein DAPPUDRAFT_100788 [Daphnia pulex]|uniref:Uncharacterized protein n=1 Tax=Daphnia pulex TaxID=6669 RepID=E9GC58_DAPPU|nr:hypothetical protein DAPPUDRAFT_100788 [Daphnia pulex]|eukprot:EFX83196.1 hypothetical protein DAPPUDRAFT_100788 [Daphnia pulex]
MEIQLKAVQLKGFKSLLMLLSSLLGSLPENLPRAFHGPITPIVLLKLVSKETLPSVKAPAVVATDQKVAKLADDNSNDEAVDRVYEIILKDKMHNLHHYINFFKSIQQAIKDNELQALQSKLDLFVSSRRN